MDWASLVAEHATLTVLTEELRQAVEEDAPDFERLARARWQLGYRLALHIAIGEKHIYPALGCHPGADLVPLAARYRAEMSNLDQQYRGYIGEWRFEDIWKRWREFRFVTIVLVNKLRRRLVLEESELFPLLDR